MLLGLLFRRLLRLLLTIRNDATWLLGPAKHLENLFRSLRPSVGLIWIDLWLLSRGIDAGRIRLHGLSGLSLVVGILLFRFFVFALVSIGRFCNHNPWRGSDDLRVEGTRRRKVVLNIRGRLDLA